MATTSVQGPVSTLNDGHTIPQLGFGTGQISTSDIVTAVSMALEIGYRHIDTAAIYGNEAGVGKAIAESGVPRSEINAGDQAVELPARVWQGGPGRPPEPGEARPGPPGSLTHPLANPAA